MLMRQNEYIWSKGLEDGIVLNSYNMELLRKFTSIISFVNGNHFNIIFNFLRQYWMGNLNTMADKENIIYISQKTNYS